MLKTKNIVSSIAEIPREWVFEFYLQLDTNLTGQDVQLPSIFKTGIDQNPSMFVYYDKDKRKYLYKDFSTDKGGDGNDLVMQMYNLTTRGESAHKIIEDYNNFVSSNPVAYLERVFNLQQKYKVVSHQIRGWTAEDQRFWTQFKIGSAELEFYNVFPLSSYNLSKMEGKEEKKLIIKSAFIYGYFKSDGTLYKIYQPKNKNNKFVFILPYIQGSEQLLYNVPNLIICSSLKDMVSFKKLGFTNAEQIAVTSENSLIEKEQMDFYKLKYKGICTLLDNDEAGIKAMDRYKKEYGIPGVHLNIEQDLAKAVKEHGLRNTRIIIQPLLKKALNEYGRI